MSAPIYIIAEAGVNHNGNLDMAFQLVDAAVEAQVDAIKFQTFIAEKLVTTTAAKADYQLQATDADESQFDMLKRLELSQSMHHELIAYCQSKGIEFLSTAFDEKSLKFLVDVLGLKTLKIPSGEITNGPLLLAHAQTGCDLVVSTGMSTLGEIETALGVLAFGLVHGKDSNAVPSEKAFRAARPSGVGRELLGQKLTLLHCTTEYPAPSEDINLTAMLTMRDEFGLRVGYSDHSKGITIPIAAAAIGASLIEKHFTLDNTLPGPDHKASLEPDELKNMVKAIRTVELAMGDGVKAPRPSELGNRDIARKSLVAARDLTVGEKYTPDMLDVKRPGTGINPMEYWKILGTKVVRNTAADEVIK
jgi:N-acetylneuraminate synthase